MPDTLVYLSYGRDCYHQETMFSILSARRAGIFSPQHAGQGSAADWRTLVYTDRPDDYRWLGVDVRPLVPGELDRWVGGGYPFRRKAACVADAVARAPGKIAFLDGDTFFRADPRHLFARIGPGHACLHLREKRLTRRPGTAGATLHRLFDTGQVRDMDGRPVKVQAGEGMWNSGVIGLDASDADKVDEVLALIDAVWEHEQSVFTLEQFAFGHVFGEGRLRETGDLVFHYWHGWQRAPFLQRLPNIIARAQTMPLAEAARWSWTQRPRVPIRQQLAGTTREAVHWIGFDRRWLRASF